jgi:uroporphyrinogen-III synthase
MLVIVTRPAAQAAVWVDALRALGQPAQALPLIEIGPADDTEPLRQAWQALAGCALVMFVSANAVQAFFALAEGAAWPAGVRAGATGPGTAAALRAVGLPEAAIVEPAADAPSFDSEALWARVSAEDWAGRQVLVVRGEEGRDWLADTLRGRGARVDFVSAYQRRVPLLDAAAQALLARALAVPAAHLWHFSSSQAVAHLRALAPGADWSRSQAIASHPRIAQAARTAGWMDVALALPVPAEVARLAASWPSIQSGRL